MRELGVFLFSADGMTIAGLPPVFKFSKSNLYTRVERDTLRVKPGRRDTPYNGLYEEAPPERGTFFALQVYKR